MPAPSSLPCWCQPCKTHEAAARTQSINNLKQIALAMHGYHDVNRKLPSAAICDAAGKPLLSWRIAILPFIDEQQLYRQFKLDKPWDSDHNRKLIPPCRSFTPSPPRRRAG